MKWQADASSGISYLAASITAFYSAAKGMNSLKHVLDIQENKKCIHKF
jgi:hypothetical protein